MAYYNSSLYCCPFLAMCFDKFNLIMTYINAISSRAVNRFSRLFFLNSWSGMKPKSDMDSNTLPALVWVRFQFHNRYGFSVNSRTGLVSVSVLRSVSDRVQFQELWVQDQLQNWFTFGNSSRTVRGSEPG